MNNPISIIISREYLERVKRKSFIISTILVPLLSILCMVAPALIMLLSPSETMTVAVVDNTHSIAQRLNNNDELRFVDYSQPLDSARANADFGAILVIGDKAIDNPEQHVQLLSHGPLSMMTDEYINNAVATAIRDVRLQAYNINNLREILDEVEVDMNIPVIDIDKGDGQASSSMLSYALALVMDMMLYMFILIYGQQVMTSIIDEKSNRVLELVVSSIKPTQLMIGKIIGIGLVAITQILIWGALIGACSAWLIPALGSAANEAPELAGMFAQLSDAGFILSLFAYMILFFIGGYLFYSSMFAAIGSAVDNVQDASQLTSVATIPIIIGIAVSMATMNNPNSTLAFWISMVPFTSPMSMMSRLPYGVPAWETILSLAILYASFLGMIWLAAKIYRVGIFMYGKKPSLAELIRWARYK